MKKEGKYDRNNEIIKKRRKMTKHWKMKEVIKDKKEGKRDCCHRKKNDGRRPLK